MTKKEVKEIFHRNGVQLSPGAYEMLEGDMRRKVRMMAKRCKRGNIKRLTEELYYIAKGLVSG